MAWNLTTQLEHRPGSLAELGERFGAAGVNIDGIYGDPDRIHILVDDADAARRVLSDAGLDVRDEKEVLVVGCPDEPGALGKRARTLADAGINIELAYLAAGTRLVLAVDDLAAARSALGA